MNLPSSLSLYQVGGSLPVAHPTYVKRQADDDFYQGLKAGEFCYVLNSRQMGKSSLRVQTMARLQGEGIACAAIDLTEIGTSDITVEEWYAGIIDSLVNSFHLYETFDLETWWMQQKLLSPVQKLSKFVENILLKELAGKVVIFIDEIDSTLKLSFKDDFFALIRAFYNKRTDNPNFYNLTFGLLGVATPSDLMKDRNRTPFNIGKAIDLKGFQLAEVKPLEKGLVAKADNPETVLQEILKWTGGQPFLTQRVCRLVANSLFPITAVSEGELIEQLVRSHIINNWESHDEQAHLKTICDRILSDEKRTGRLLGLYQQILQQGEINKDDSSEQIELRLSGLVVERKNKLIVYNCIYKSVFGQNWIEQELANIRPYAEAFTAWVVSNCQDESRLLRGKALEQSLGWASNKSLSDLDYKFLAASQALDNKEIKANLEAAEKANRILKEAESKAKKALQKAEIALQEERLAKQRLIEAKQEEEQTRRREQETRRKAVEAQRQAEEAQRQAEEAQRQVEEEERKLARLATRSRGRKLYRSIYSPPLLGLAIVSLISIVGYRFYNQPQGIDWKGLGYSAMLVVVAISIFCQVVRRRARYLRRRDHILLCLLSLSAPLLANLGFPYTDLPAVGLLVSSFYSPSLAVTQVALLAGLSIFSVGAIGWEYLLSGAAGGMLAAAIAGRLRSREELAFLGGAVGLSQGGAYLIVNLVLSAAAGTIWYAVLPGAIIYGLSGLAWCVVALGISPYLERLFDVTTTIRLVELSNHNSPLLKRLATEAPGTFQHTLFVVSLAEAAGRAMHCNVELISAGALYHDIGKMHDPLAFIENQMGGPNKHDEINDPWKSVEIIKKHVSEGLVMARKYGLPEVIQEFIPEPRGTLLISYFYHQAKQEAEKEGKGEVFLEEYFRYEGPIPQSRETAIVMLADSCEAALRSLREATTEVAAMTVKKIFQARWQEGQLWDSGIAYEELPVISEIFVRVWQQFHHQRIAYPKL